MAPTVQYKELWDREWLAVQAAAGRYPADVADELGCAPQTVRAAYRRYDLKVEPRMRSGMCDPVYCDYWEVCLDGPVDALPPCMTGGVVEDAGSIWSDC